MVSQKKRAKANKQSEKIAKMRDDVLNEIRKDEMKKGLKQTKKNDESAVVDEIKIKQPDQEKKTFDVLENSAKTKEVSAPKSIAKPVVIDVKVKSVFKKKKKKTRQIALKPKAVVLEEPTAPKLSQDKNIDSSKLNYIIRKQTDLKPRSKKINIFALFAAGLILSCLAFAAFIFYIPKSESLPARKISEAVPCPAIIINGKFISYNDYLKEVDAVDIFLSRQQRAGVIRELPPRKQIREEIANLLIKQEIIKNLASQYEITVSQKEVDDEMNKIKEQSRSEESFKDVLKNLYGWNEEDFGNKVIKNYLLVSKLSSKFFPDVSSDELKELFDKKIEETKRGMNIYVLVK